MAPVKKKIALLGATGHIAKNIIFWSCKESKYELCLFARSPERVKAFLSTIGECSDVSVGNFEGFNDGVFDVVINCVGIGAPQKLKADLLTIFATTEYFDNLILNYLGHRPQTLYINLSSGAAYGTNFTVPVTQESFSTFGINNLDASEYYGIAKINSEAKHRALHDLNIVDLRVFAFFSRFIDVEERFLLSEIISCIKNKKEFVTGPGDITRDYVHVSDLMSMMDIIVNTMQVNDVFDVYSRKPARKFELIDFFAERYGLKYSVMDTFEALSVTGTKNNYFSLNKKAELLGYLPQYSSLEAIAEEAAIILSS